MADRRKQKNIRRNRGRRGAGLEMAMLLMLVAVALSGLLTSVAIMQVDKQKDSEEHLELLEQRMVLDQIGRDFCSQRESYALPEDLGLYEVITYGYGTDESGAEKECPGCCLGCAECNPETNENTDPTEPGENVTPIEQSENAAATETNENTSDAETGEDIGDAEGEDSSGCCADCDCTIGCTGYTEISLVVLSDSGEVVLSVELANNQDGTYTVTKWSYGE